jgi:PadR family transcriptional regulator PadR
MGRAPGYRHRIELLQGTLDMLILRTLQRREEHGLAIAQAICAKSAELLHIETGSLYPALHRLEKRGWLDSSWKTSDKNQRAKYYRLTSAGRRQLVSEQTKWQMLVKAITGVMRPA